MELVCPLSLHIFVPWCLSEPTDSCTLHEIWGSYDGVHDDYSLLERDALS